MVTKVHGGVSEGLWFSADVVFATLTVTGATFATDAATPAPNSSLEKVIEAVKTRGTVIGVRVTGETVVQLMIDFGQAYATSGTTVGNQAGTDVLTEVEGLIDADGALSGSAFTNVGTDFTAG